MVEVAPEPTLREVLGQRPGDPETLNRVGMEAEQIRNIARQRGLNDKATAIEASLAKLRDYARTVSQTLQSVNKQAT